MIELFNLTHKQLIEVVEQNGFKKFRGNQIFEWIYAKTEFDFEKKCIKIVRRLKWL